MSEEMIVRHCSPTLAGMKTGSMFSCTVASKSELHAQLRQWNQLLRKKGLRLIPLRLHRNRALMYPYRPSRLSQDFQHHIADRLLRERGYGTESQGQCITHLRKRLAEEDEFPHEIGLFLGYPPEDVSGFIENRATGCKIVGNWKVYGDEEAAQRIFNKYKKCTHVYCDQLAKGRPIERLVIAG